MHGGEFIAAKFIKSTRNIFILVIFSDIILLKCLHWISEVLKIKIIIYIHNF